MKTICKLVSRIAGGDRLRDCVLGHRRREAWTWWRGGGGGGGGGARPSMGHVGGGGGRPSMAAAGVTAVALRCRARRLRGPAPTDLRWAMPRGPVMPRVAAGGGVSIRPEAVGQM